MRQECAGCGACCRTIAVEQSPDEMRRMAALTRVIGFPSDHQFTAEHWQPLTRDEAMARNPLYVTRVGPDLHWYACDRLGSDGLCTVYEERPLVCRGYPWYGEAPSAFPLADPECVYAAEMPDGAKR